MKKVMTVFLFAFAMLFQLSANENWFAEKFPEKLINKSGKEVDAATALKDKMVAVYFSASWCGPCRGFTPILVKFYKQTAKKSGIELIFVSSDKTSADMMGYMEKYSMPWLGLPFDALQKTALKKELGVAGIPRLVVFGKDGKLLSRDARWDVTILGAKAVEAWQKEDYKPLTYQDAKKLKDSSKNNVKTKNKKKTKRTKTW